MKELTQQELDTCIKMLLQLRDELEKMLATTKFGSAPVSLDLPIGRLSRMDAIQQQKMAEAQYQRTKQLLAQIKVALTRVENGSYGECVLCEDQIGFDRLKAFPENMICRDCLQARNKE